MALIDLSQIKGGARLATTVDNFNSFMIAHTTAVKDEFPVIQQTTQFTLTAAPADAPVTLDINGVIYKENIDFTMDRQTRTVTWTSTDFDITPDLTDLVTVNYSIAYTATNGSSAYTPRAAEHMYGMVLAQEGGRTGTWVRVNQDLQTVAFDASHGTWAGIHPVVNPVHGEFVEIPVTYVKTETLTTGQYAGKTCYWTADGYADGFHAHPAFIGADGQPHPLQVSAWIVSNKSDVPFSEDKGALSESYWISSYNDLRAMGWAADNVRPYNIYDHHLLARLMLTEFGTPDVQAQTVDGVKWDSSARIAYHGVHDPFGTVHSTAGRTRLWLDGLFTKDGTYKVMVPDGSLQVVETNIAHPGVNWVVNCYTDKVDTIDFGDLFLPKTTASAENDGSFADQAYVSGSNAYCVFFPANSLYGAFFLMHTNPEYSNGTCWRMCRCGD